MGCEFGNWVEAQVIFDALIIKANAITKDAGIESLFTTIWHI